MTTKRTIGLLTGAAVLAMGLAGTAMAERGPGDGMGPGGMGMMLNFDAMDADKDGKLTQAEVDTYKAAEFAKADTNADGKLDATEMAAMQEAAMKAAMQDRAAKMIERIDSDGDGMISAEELAAGPQPKSLFDRLDGDGDGALTKAEVDAAKERFAERKGPRGDKHGHGMMDGFFGGGPDTEQN